MDALAKFLGAGFLVALVIFLFALAPLINIWALNTISEEAHWGWHIPHTFWTYIAVWVIVASTHGGTSSKKD